MLHLRYKTLQAQPYLSNSGYCKLNRWYHDPRIVAIGFGGKGRENVEAKQTANLFSVKDFLFAAKLSPLCYSSNIKSLEIYLLYILLH
jgi:hypothetical protein